MRPTEPEECCCWSCAEAPPLTQVKAKPVRRTRNAPLFNALPCG